MKTAVVISDTHGNLRNLRKLYEVMEESDYVFHLGDLTCDVAEIKARFPEKLLCVAGNCDGGHGANTVEIEDVKVLYTHGHDFHVKSSLDELYRYAFDSGVKVALYGHTHEKSVKRLGDVLMVNPGALGDFFTPSYAYLVFSNGKVIEKLVNLY